jgi:hypothetical protein
MSDIIVALVFVAMILAPAIVASRAGEEKA